MWFYLESYKEPVKVLSSEGQSKGPLGFKRVINVSDFKLIAFREE